MTTEPMPEETVSRNSDGSIHAPVRIGVGTATAWVDLRPGEPGYEEFSAFLEPVSLSESVELSSTDQIKALRVQAAQLRASAVGKPAAQAKKIRLKAAAVSARASVMAAQGSAAATQAKEAAAPGKAKAKASKKAAAASRHAQGVKKAALKKAVAVKKKAAVGAAKAAGVKDQLKKEAGYQKQIDAEKGKQAKLNGQPTLPKGATHWKHGWVPVDANGKQVGPSQAPKVGKTNSGKRPKGTARGITK